MAIRTYGLSGSGIDVDQMVKDLMKARRASYDKIWQKKTQLEYKKKDYNTIYTTLKEFREKTVFDFRMSSQLKPKKVTASDETLASVAANADAIPISHTLKVNQLAESVKKQSAANISPENADKSSIAAQFNLTDATGFTITINDGTTAKTITVDPSKSLNDFAAGINSAGTNIRAGYDATLDRFYIYNLKTGSDAKVILTDAQVKASDGTVLVNNFLADILKIDTVPEEGKNALITLDGVDVIQQTNNFTAAGMTFNLKAADPAKTISLNVSADIDKAVSNVKAFIDSYNALVTQINTELNEKYYRDYLPLTDAQKKEMKEDEIKAWEERAKSGMLRRDPVLQNLLSNMRLNFAAPVEGLEGKYKSAIDLGITTSSYVDESGKFVDVTSKGGVLSVNEEKLRKALAEDPDILYKVFATDGEDTKSDGVARRLYDTLKTGIDNVVAAAGKSADLTGDTQSVLAKQLTDYNKRLASEDTRLKRLEEMYYKQFDAMEAALNKMNQQSAWLLQQFSSN